jgi:class 3 adenylate cyclase/tetratricopeptide (TPR) repeat protein
VLRSAPVLPDLQVSEPDDSGVDVRALLPPPVRAHLVADTGTAEHRPIAVAFIQFAGTDALLTQHGAAAVADALDECVRNVQHACAAHGVSFLESDINRDGGKFMLAAGAPRSHGDDDDRMVRAVQLAVARSGRLNLRAGINHGRVFSADFGPEFRRTYSIKGDAINTAARVMGKAEPGSVLATAEVLARTRTRFALTPVPPFMVKGKAAPIEASLVGPPESEAEDRTFAVDEGPFVGRESELATARDAIARAADGHGTVLEVVGEPGMGKSRLVHEILRAGGALTVRRAPSSAYESATPYYPVRTLLRDLFGLADGSADADPGRQLRSIVRDRAPHLLPWLPLVGVVLDVAVPSTRETEELDPTLRHERLQQTLVDLLEHLLDSPTILICENTQLMDDATAELFARLEARIARLPWVVLVTRRELATGYAPDRSADGVAPLVLAPISEALSRALLDDVSQHTPLSAHALAAITAKAGGNPLFLKALVSAAVHAGSAADLPDSVEDVLTREIDRLEPGDRVVLRYAAVLGVEFSEVLLRDLLTHSGHPADAELGRLGEFLEPAGGDAWRFRHALIRDAAYAGLPYRVRRAVHARAGEVLEAEAANPEELSERLSLHFFHSNSYERAWTYSGMAGRRAQAQYAYTGAIEFFERALEAGRESGVPAAELADVLEALGDVCDIAGFSDDAIRNYRRARPYRRDDPLGRATLMLKEAGVHQRMGAFVTSLRLLSHARTVLRDRADALTESTRSRLATRYAFGRYLQGRHASAAKWSQIGVHEAQASGDREALAYAYNTRHLACIHAGIPEDEPYGELALAIYTELGNLRMQANCLNNLAISAMQEGRWTASADHLDRAVELLRRIGDTANEANALYNRADLLIRQHRYAQARPLLAAAGRAARAAGDRELVALAARESGRAATGLGDFADAADQFDEARKGFLELGLTHEMITLDASMAEMLASSGSVDAALELIGDALARAHHSGADSELAALNRIHGSVLVAAGRHAEAAAAYEAGLRSPDAGDGHREHALNMLGLAALAPHHPVEDPGRLAAEASAILSALDVVLTPE